MHEQKWVLSFCRLLMAITLLLGYAETALSAQAKVVSARLWNNPEYTRLVLELSQPVDHKVMVLSKPDRLVLDIQNTYKKINLKDVNLGASPVKAIRSAGRNSKDLRIVLDLKDKSKAKSFMLKPNDHYGDRLVIDLYPSVKKHVSKRKVSQKTIAFAAQKKRDIIIMIDPGHGGEDPGAIGPKHIKEKNIVLAIAKELKKQINAKRGFKAYLTRDRDYYIGLRKRTQIARKYNTDLMVSIHADAFKKSQAYGASVYALSNRGATSEAARWLAKKENSADLIGGDGSVSLEDKDDVLAGVLLDLSSTASLKASLNVGSRVLKSMGHFARLHKHSVQQAGFVVLKSPDIPSILIETGFVSNPAESRRLNTSKYQRQMASAINKGITHYFEQSPPPGTLLAWGNQQQTQSLSLMRYVVRKGDTLSHIAMRNDVTLKKLRQLNRLRNDNVWVGQRLQVPSS